MAAVPCPWQAFLLPASVGILVLKMLFPWAPAPAPNLMNILERNHGAVLFLLILISRNTINYWDKFLAVTFY